MSVPEPVRTLAFDEILQLPEANEHASSQSAAALDALTPELRTRAVHIATRRLAFQILFEMDARNVTDPAFVDNTLMYVEGLTASGAAELGVMIRSAHEARSKADAVFRELAPEWPTHRLAGTDRAILRLAHHELTLGTTPAAIIINEAVELAKHYSTDRSPPFINALLDKAAKRIKGEGASTSPPVL